MKGKILKQTERILVRGQTYRDSDKPLLLAFWATEGLHLDPMQTRAFMNCTNADSITRARRKLKAKYPASEAVDNERYSKFKKYRDGEII